MFKRFAPVLVVVLMLAGVGASLAQTPVVTIDSNKNFCINGTPTFLIGTMGGDATAWQNNLKPAGFNVRFLGTTSTPGAHSVGLWELPDVFSDPSQIATMKLDPGYLMWNAGYEINVPLFQSSTSWLGYTLPDLNTKIAQCRSYDSTPLRPVGICWGNNYDIAAQSDGPGSEGWGGDGYWAAYRQYAQLGDYFISGECNCGFIDEQTASHAVRMTNGSTIVLNRCWPNPDVGGQYRPEPAEVRMDIWQAVITGARGIIIDRYEMQGSDGVWRSWPLWYPDHWAVIKQGCKEVQDISSVLLNTGTTPIPWMYYNSKTIESQDEYHLLYTFRKVGSGSSASVYMIACNTWPPDPQSQEIMVPVSQSNAVGEVLWDYMATGAVMLNPTTTMITDYTQNWTPNDFAGHRLWIWHGSPVHNHYYPILSNTATTITISSGNLLTDGVARGDFFHAVELVTLNNWRFLLELEAGGRKAIKFSNVSYNYPAQKSAAAVSTASNRKWKLLMDYSGQLGGEPYLVDAYGLCYDAYRHRLVAQGGLMNPYPQGKPNPTDPDVAKNRNVWEWDLDSGSYSGPIMDGEQQGGDPWPSQDFYYGDTVYDPDRHCTISFLKGDVIQEWRGIQDGWRVVAQAIPDKYEGPITHYAGCYDTYNDRMLIYGGKDWTVLGSNFRNWQFYYEWINGLWAWNGTSWENLNNPDVNWPQTALEEPVMCWDSTRNYAVMFGLAHDGRWNKDTAPQSIFQSTAQRTFELTSGIWCNRVYTTHVPYVYANYQMVFDPRTNTTLLFGGLPSVNGRYTDLYSYNGSDWTRLNYDCNSLPAQDVRRIPTLAYDPDHEMVLFVDTRGHKIWGLTSGLETQVASVNGVKSLADGTLIAIDGKVVSRRYNGYFYMQESDRMGGIRVSSSATAPAEGKIANVIGTVSTLATGEKQIIAKTVGIAGSSEMKPLGMTSFALGGAAGSGNPGVYEGVGTNNIGLLVKVFGEVTYVGSDYVYIDDGMNLEDGSGHVGVKVVLNGVSAPSLYQFVCVTGVSGIESISGHNTRVVLLAQTADLL